MKLLIVVILPLIMFFITSIMQPDFNLLTSAKVRDYFLPLSYEQGEEIKKQRDKNAESAHNKTSALATVDNKVHATLIVTTKVINEGGGSSEPSDFTIKVHGNNPSTSSFPGNSSGTVVKLDMGMYSITESGLLDYNSTSSMDCSGAVMAVETLKCDITNTYIKPVAEDN